MMKKLLKPLALAALAALCLAPRRSTAQTKNQASAQPSQQQSTPREKWERYTYEGEEFSVETPEMPFVFETSRSVGPTESESMRDFGLYSDGVVYIITSYDNPREAESLDYFASYDWSDPNLKVVSAIKLGGFEGREYESAHGYTLRERVFLTKRHAYRLRAVSYGGEDPRFARFLDSFALGGEPSGRAIHDMPPPPAVSAAWPTAEPVGPGRGGIAGAAQPTGEGEKPAYVADGPYKPSEVKRKAIIVFKPAPGFTEEARRSNVAGTVRLRVVLTSDGKVRGVSVVRGLPDGLTKRAINAARHILFLPAQKDGQAVSQYATLEYNFKIY